MTITRNEFPYVIPNNDRLIRLIYWCGDLLDLPFEYVTIARLKDGKWYKVEQDYKLTDLMIEKEFTPIAWEELTKQEIINIDQWWKK